MNEPRNWKWMVPAAAVPALLIAAIGLQLISEQLPILLTFGCQCGMLALMCIAAAAAASNYHAYFEQLRVDALMDRRRALATTAESMLFEQARGMHPEAVRLLLLQRKMLWRIKMATRDELVDWVLDEAPMVHAGFVQFFLEKSTPVSCMPKRMLSEGSKQFDPQGLATDYQQYDSLLLLLQRHLMATQAFGNQSAQWLPPWNPEMAAKAFGLTEEEAVGDQQLAVSGEKLVERGLEDLEQTAMMRAQRRMN